MNVWIYKQSEPGLWTVGFYDPVGNWYTDTDHDSREAAADRVAYLNGSNNAEIDRLRAENARLVEMIRDVAEYCRENFDVLDGPNGKHQPNIYMEIYFVLTDHDRRTVP